jgi:hypothetical protein
MVAPGPRSRRDAKSTVYAIERLEELFPRGSRSFWREAIADAAARVNHRGRCGSDSGRPLTNTIPAAATVPPMKARADQGSSVRNGLAS